MMNTSYVASITCLTLSAKYYAAEGVHLDAVYILYGPMEDVVEKPIALSKASPISFDVYT
jgi:hypothetical protein